MQSDQKQSVTPFRHR